MLGNHIQGGGGFSLIDASTMQVNGSFAYTGGNTLEVRNNSNLTTGNLTSGLSVANNVLVDSGGNVTIGHLTAHGNVTVNNSTSVLRVGGDYLQDAGGFTMGDNGTLNVDGSFRFMVGGPRFIDFGNGFLRVGDTLTIEEGHFWNLSTSGGRVRVGDGFTPPAAGRFEITTRGTLAGDGTIIGNLVNTSGTVAPGSSPGRLDVTGNYTQGATADLSVEIGGTLAEIQYDQLFVSGTASLAGSLTVDLIDLGIGEFAPLLGQTFDILKAGGGRSGTFANVSYPVIGGGLGWQLNYLANRVQLEIIAAASLPGDFDLDGDVDGRDFLFWQRNPSIGNLDDWQTHYGTSSLVAAVSVPEPSSMALILLISTGIAFQRSRSTVAH